MGLAGPKNRFKISKDPNNTTWSRNTDRFGHRILTAQGWKPGSHLGSQSSEHAAHHTAASFSHVRVLLKDDNLGLGAKRGSERAENFGMAGFDDLLARLNGKSEEKIQEQKSKRRDADLKVFVSQRWGTMMFVSGGFLVGDQIVKRKDGKVPLGGGTTIEEPVEEATRPKKESSKKRRRVEEEASLETIDEDEEPKLKRKKRKSNLRVELALDTSDSESKKEKKKSKKSKDGQSDAAASENKSKKRKHTDVSSDSESSSELKRSRSAKSIKDDKSERKAAKKAEKEARKATEKAEKAARKEAKRLKKSKSTNTLPTPAGTASSSTSPAPAAAAEAAPVNNTVPNTARHAARRRYIMAKRSAIMDPQALKEIFMIKGTG